MTKRTATTMPTAPPAFDWTGDVAMMYLRIEWYQDNGNLNQIDDDQM